MVIFIFGATGGEDSGGYATAEVIAVRNMEEDDVESIDEDVDVVGSVDEDVV